MLRYFQIYEKIILFFDIYMRKLIYEQIIQNSKYRKIKATI